jgi:RNA polymerase sigma-70 factor, ECF subfamily
MKTEGEFFYNAIRKGDIKAFESFYMKYQPRLFAYGVGILNDEEASRDLAQETFITFWENKDRLVTDYSVTAYLFKIFQSKCIKHLRSSAIHSNFSHLSDLKLKEIEISLSNTDSNAMGTVFMQDVETLYEKAIEKLPPQCREIFILSKEEQFKSAEIASQLGISVRTVENQIYKAIRVMRQAMEEYSVQTVVLLLLLSGILKDLPL